MHGPRADRHCAAIVTTGLAVLVAVASQPRRRKRRRRRRRRLARGVLGRRQGARLPRRPAGVPARDTATGAVGGGAPGRDGKTGAMIATLPLGLNLTEPITVKVDNGAAERQSIQTCTNVGCFVTMTMTDKMLAAMRAAANSRSPCRTSTRSRSRSACRCSVSGLPSTRPSEARRIIRCVHSIRLRRSPSFSRLALRRA